MLTLLAHHFALAQSANPAAQQQQRNTRPWYEAYDEGLRNIQQQRWQQAIDSLLAAKTARAQQSRRVAFYGDRVDAYIPDYYLGVAYTELGRFADAEAAFQRVTDQKLVVQGDRTFQNFQTQSARARTGAVALARGGGAQAPQQTASNTTTPAAPGGGPPPIQTPVQTQVQTPAPVQNPVTQQPDTTVATGPGAATLPGPAVPPAGPVQNNTVNPSAVLPGFTVPNLVRLSEAAANARLRQVSLALGQVNRLAGASLSAPANTVISQTPAAGTRVQGGTRVNLTLSGPAAAPRLTEIDAVTAFFGGDYGTAGQILESIVAANGKNGPAPTPRAWLFLASSMTAQVLTGDRDRAELDAARNLLARAGPLTQFASDRRLISPRIWNALGVQP